MSNTLFELTAEQQAIESLLYENDGELTPELEQMMETNRESLLHKADNINMVIHHLESQADYLEKEIKRLQALKKTADNSVKRLKDHVLSVMEKFDLQRIEGTTFKMFSRDTKSIEVDEGTLLFEHLEAIAQLENTLPNYISLEPKVSKSEIKNTYKNTGNLPNGCVIANKKSLTIK